MNIKLCKNNHSYEPIPGSHKGCGACRKLYKSVYDTENKEKNKNYDKQYYQLNIEKRKAYHKSYLQANKHRYNARTMKRHAAKLQRTPRWLTKQHLKEIRSFYLEAKELQWLSNDSLEVDHIVPLQGKTVSGLHVPWNLQILPKSVNCIKSNKVAA